MSNHSDGQRLFVNYAEQNMIIPQDHKTVCLIVRILFSPCFGKNKTFFVFINVSPTIYCTKLTADNPCIAIFFYLCSSHKWHYHLLRCLFSPIQTKAIIFANYHTPWNAINTIMVHLNYFSFSYRNQGWLDQVIQDR